MEKELTFERVKVAELQGLLELERSRELPLPGERSPGKALFSSTFFPPLFCQACRLVEKGYHVQAIKAFQAFVEEYPRHPLADDALFYMAREYMVLGDQKKALAVYSRLLRDYPDSDRLSMARLKMGLILIGQGRIKEGEEKIREVLRGQPYTLGTQEAKVLQKGEEK